MAERLTRQESRRRTRGRLLEAAAELIAERGVNGASVEQIAERAGYSRGAFYGNFDGKDALVAELLAERTRREAEEVREATAGAATRAEAFDALRAWNRERARNLESWLALRMELLLHAIRTPELRPLLAEREQAARSALAEGVRRELDRDGAAPPADPAFLALIAHALEDGLLIQRVLDPAAVGDEAVVDAVELLLRSWTALGGEAAEEGGT